MLNRLAGLLRRTAQIYRETGSGVRAGRYLGKVLASKASATLGYFRELFRDVLLGRGSARAAALQQNRSDGTVSVCVGATGGLGDLIVIARCLRDMRAAVEPFSFDIFYAHPAVARWVFDSVAGFREAHADALLDIATKDFDLRLTMNSAIIVHYEFLRFGSLRHAPRLGGVIGAITRMRHRGLDPYIIYHPHLDNGLARRAVFSNRSRRDFLHHLAGIQYGGDALDIASDDHAVESHGLDRRRYLTIHNGFDTNFVIAGRRATKCYPHFPQVVAGIKAARPDILIVQIGTVTSDPIPGVDIDLVGRTSLRESAGLIKRAALHIDNEGGLVHLAACYGTLSLVLYGPTPSDYFGYPTNINIDPIHCGGCWWIEDLWMDRCPRGMAEPECLYGQPPQGVVAKAVAALSGADEIR